jgi:hypothetical protein
MTTLIGSAPNQVPTNADLGGLAYQNPKYVQIQGGNVNITNFSTANLVTTGNTTISGTATRLIGDFNNVTVASRLIFTNPASTSANVGIYAAPTGTAVGASWQAVNAADPTNASKILITATGTDTQLVSGRNGSGTYLPLAFWTNGQEQLRIDQNTGNLVVWNNANITGNVLSASVNTGNVFIANAQYSATEAMPKSYTDVFTIVFGT